jgi:hypothetical protein
MTWEQVRKAITAVVGAAIAFASLVILSDASEIQPEEWLTGAIGLATALGVYAVPNAPGPND